ncbi:toxin-antitoxin system HicB family antitoxin [Geobacillus sp. E263]|uniref:toxin-antitoxin system HicB family antitoxin n=1 Tax=Geobacillus sp. E263 TaxID=391290 RepID=UPI00117BBC1D|nr:toxin-antitoxin system HicB family antitoxin [Geobacillus sp. E263]
MAKKKSFPLRIDPALYEVIERWAHDEFRSVNAHIEFLLREAAKRAGRLTQRKINTDNPPNERS